jgi:hypothetical protein
MANPKSKEPGLGETLVRMKLRYEMSDANVLDRYLFTLELGKDLQVHYDGAGGSGDLTFAPTALESAASHIVLSQGDALSSASPPDLLPDLITSDLPPFLLSRSVFAALKEKGKAKFKFEWSPETSEVVLKAKKSLSILLDGKKTSVPVVHCLGDLQECELWVLDDAMWPVILRHEEGEDRSYFWKLVEAGKRLEPAAD